MNQGSSATLWYIIGAIVIIALAFWYFSSPATPSTSPTATTQTPSDTTTAAISADLNQTSDGSAELTAAQAASAQAVQGF